MATRVLIGVTWLTTTTVLPACASQHPVEPGQHPLLDRRGTTRRPLAATSSEPEPGVEPAWSRSATSAKVSPSQAPNSISAKPGSTSTGWPSTSARISADSRVRRTGEATTASIRSASGASQSAVARIWARPSSLSPGLALGEPAGEPLADGVRRDAVPHQDQRGRRGPGGHQPRVGFASAVLDLGSICGSSTQGGAGAR